MKLSMFIMVFLRNKRRGRKSHTNKATIYFSGAQDLRRKLLEIKVLGELSANIHTF